MSTSPIPAGYARHNEYQREYFEARSKPTMRPRDTPYVHRQTEELTAFAGIATTDRIVDVGCGEGRYTIPLAARGFDVEGLDLAPVLLERLTESAGGRFDIPLHAADVMAPPAELHERYDAAVGFFALHHFHDLEACFRGIARLVRPGGTITFLEPNPLNPLYYVQIAVTPRMTWEGDGGLVRMHPRTLDRAARAAGLEDMRFRRFGFFPPMVANRPRGRALERQLEGFPPLKPVLPFTLVRWRRP
jgi:SAM-dependent methyltransferase